MKKSIKTLLIVCLLVAMLIAASACGGSSQIAKGTYKLDTVQINGKTVAIPSYAAMPTMPIKPVRLPELPYGPKPDPGIAPEESDFVLAGMTEDQKIVARSEFAIAKAEYNALVIEAEAWQAQKEAHDAIYPSEWADNNAAWDTYNAQMDAYDNLFDAWDIDCQSATYDALRAAGIDAYTAWNVSKGYPVFMILKALEICVGDNNAISFKNFDAINDMIATEILGVLGIEVGVALEFIELTCELNSNSEIVLSIGAPGMRVGISTSVLTYKDGKINFGLDLGEFALEIAFKKLK